MAALSGARFVHARLIARLPRAGPVHAGPADRHARLHRVLHALYRQCFDAGTGQLPKFKDDMFAVSKGGGDDDPKVDDQGKPYVREDST